MATGRVRVNVGDEATTGDFVVDGDLRVDGGDLSIGTTTANETLNIAGVTTASGKGSNFIIKGGDATGTNLTGGYLALQPGMGTGSGVSGDILLQTGPAGASGASQNTATTVLTCTSAGTVVIGGNVGIGTSTPATALSVYTTASTDGILLDGSTFPAITLQGAGTTRGYIGIATGSGGFVDNSATGDLIIRSVSTKLHLATAQSAATLTVSGTNVGIGTTTPTSPLQVVGNIAVTGTVDGRDVAADGTKLDGVASSANNYSHPTYAGDDFSLDSEALSGATVISDIDINISTDSTGHVTDTNGTVSTRTLTLGNLGYTGATDANNYSHPTGPGNEHIPPDGNPGEFLKYASSGTATWAADNNTTYSVGDGGLTQKNFTTTLKTKLDGIEANATANQTAAEIRSLVGAADDSNVYTDAEKNRVGADYLPLAGGTVTGATTITLSGGASGKVLTIGNDASLWDIGSTGRIGVQDSVGSVNGGIQLGSGGGQIYGDATPSRRMVLYAERLQVTNYAGLENLIQADAGGAVTLYHDNTARIATSGTGVTVTGDVAATTVDIASTLDVGDVLHITHPVDISPSSAGVGQLRITGGLDDGSGEAETYTGFVAMDEVGMYIGHNSSNRWLKFQTNEADALAITSSGGVIPQNLVALSGTGANYNTSYGYLQKDTSSIRYKTLAAETVVSEMPLDTIDSLEPKVFAYKAAPDLPHIGLIAEEAHDVSPYLVIQDYNDGDPRPEAMLWPAVTSLLINVVKDLRTRLAALEA